MRFLLCLLLLGFSHAISAESSPTNNPAVPDTLTAKTQTEDWLFLDNGQIRLGVLKSSGSGIAWFSDSKSDRNLVNHFDRGRLIQQSYYGQQDGSLWNKQPWRWNPVQGGDWRGAPAKTLQLTATTNSLYAKTLPKHWAGGQDLTNTLMEQWITLTGRVAHVRYKFTYTGSTSHPECDQEIPAFFVAPDLDTLVLYNGPKPWTGDTLHRSRPGWPNESRTFTESWAAYVDKSDYGIGLYVPIAKNLTCYRFGDGDPQHGSCSYFAPLTRFAIHPGFVFEYELWLTAGPLETIRERFKAIASRGHARRN